MRMVLGFDGGGTKTECVLMDETRKVLARGRSGPSSPMRVGFGGAMAALCDGSQITLQNAKLSPADLTAVCAGLAGVAQPESAEKIKHLLEEEFPGKLVHVCTDLDLTLEATGSGPAIVLVAGTGSAAVGRGCNGQVARVGGHGFLLADEGSAYDVGQRAVVAALRAMDRGEDKSPLAARVLRDLRMSGWQELQLHVYRAPDEVFPRVFPVVAAAGDEGDAEARRLLQEAACALAGLVSDLMCRLELSPQKFVLVKSGGMIGRSAYFDQALDERLRLAAPRAEFGALAMSAAEAAGIMALRLLSESANA